MDTNHIEASQEEIDLIMNYMEWAGMSKTIDWNTIMLVVIKLDSSYIKHQLSGCNINYIYFLVIKAIKTLMKQ